MTRYLPLVVLAALAKQAVAATVAVEKSSTTTVMTDEPTPRDNHRSETLPATTRKKTATAADRHETIETKERRVTQKNRETKPKTFDNDDEATTTTTTVETKARRKARDDNNNNDNQEPFYRLQNLKLYCSIALLAACAAGATVGVLLSPPSSSVAHQYPRG